MIENKYLKHDAEAVAINLIVYMYHIGNRTHVTVLVS